MISENILRAMSDKQRSAAARHKNPAVMEHVILGDKYHAMGNEPEEARCHRFAQEQLTDKFNDPESKKAWGWNCKVIHRPDLYPYK